MLAFFAFCDMVDTSKLVFAVMKPKPARGDHLISLTYIQNGKTIAIREYQSGELVESSGKIPDGVVLELHDDGTFNNVVTFSNGQRLGPAVSYYNNGKVNSYGWYANDYPDGEVRFYSESGTLTEIHHLDGGKIIKVDKYDESGQFIKTEQW